MEASPDSLTQSTEWLLNGDKALWETYIPPLPPGVISQQIQGESIEEKFVPEPEELISQSADVQSKRSFCDRTYMSFGNEGTTATVTEAGQQMQICQYLEHGSASIYSIDHENTSEPFLMQRRARDLQNLVETSNGFGPDVLLWDSTRSPDDWSVSTSWVRNQWPRVVIREDNNWEVVLQWYIHNGVVILDFVLHNRKEYPLNVGCTSNFSIRIRELDFASSDHSFNKGKEPFAEGTGPGGYGFVRIQRLPKSDATSEQPSEPDAIAAVLGLFIDGQAVTKKEYEAKYNDLYIPANGTFRLTVGNKLVFLKQQAGKENWKRLVLKTEDVNINQFLLETRSEYEPLQGQSLPKDDFYIIRNVEHILSVCMIPISDGPAADFPAFEASVDHELDEQSTNETDKPGPRAIALTCGDIYGHRICVSASFFAFKFLLDAARRLSDGHPVKTRIKEKCLAHLRWVFDRSRSNNSPDFARNYYVNGNIMPGSLTLPRDGLTDTPFQILKLYEYWKLFPEQKDQMKSFLESNDHAMKWVKALDEKSKGDAFVWRHSQRASLDYFRLDDHFWIWNAIAAIGDILEWDRMGKWTRKQKNTGETDWQKEKNSLMRKYKPEKVRLEILRRFTTVYDATKQRMLAVTRSPRETRFELHARDTALFYHIANSDMLAPQEPRWLNTLQIQKSFLVNQESDSYNPLRHGLAMLMASKGISISGLDTGLIESDAINVLMTTISSNGLFVFPLDDIVDRDGNAKDPDYLAHVSFELPFLFLHLQRSIKEGTIQKEAVQNDEQPGEDGTRNTSVKSGITPFNDQIDIKNIVDVKEEWLYNPPGFLNWEMPTTERLSGQIYSLESSTNFPELQQTAAAHQNYDIVGQSAQSFIHKYSHLPPNQFVYEPAGNPNGCQALIDVGKKAFRNQGALAGSVPLETITDIWKRLQKKRTAHEAKKRFMWCGNPSLDYPLMCYLSSPDSEKAFIRAFFNRHARGRHFFGDRTSRVQNTWITEFHCSFLQFESGDPRSDDQEEEEEEESNGKITQRESPILNSFPVIHLARGDSYARLSATSASFRFCGDFFDRFWTCHHVESYPNLRHKADFSSKQAVRTDVKMDEFLSDKNLEEIFKGSNEAVWRQRKVLELLLFYRIINKVNQNGTIILRVIQEALRSVQSRINQNSQKDRSGVNSFFATSDIFDARAEVFFNSLATWTKLDNLLEHLDNNLEMILGNIKRWDSREQDRQPEKPRWTNKDERKYRDAINRALHLCQMAERGLEANKSQIASLKRKLEKERGEAQNNYNRDISERSYRQSLNITYFTYSTVIFLPLGFAASIYSMQATPPTDVLRHMEICAIVTFAVLIFILALPRCLRILRNLGRALKSPWDHSADERYLRPEAVDPKNNMGEVPYAEWVDDIINYKPWDARVLAALGYVWGKFKRSFHNGRKPPNGGPV